MSSNQSLPKTAESSITEFAYGCFDAFAEFMAKRDARWEKVAESRKREKEADQ